MKCQAKAALILLSIIATFASAQSPTGSSVPKVAPQVRPALPLRQLPNEQDPAAREKAQLEAARELVQAQEEARWAREAQARGYWVDQSTGLMWAAKDNGKRVGWHQAMRYCRKLRLADYSDWTLATIDELERLIDNTWSPVPAGEVRGYLLGGHVVREVTITGPGLWSSNPIVDVRGHPSRTFFWYFNYTMGRKEVGAEDWAEGDHLTALCVRRPGA
jgi:hypothetical protein